MTRRPRRFLMRSAAALASPTFAAPVVAQDRNANSELGSAVIGYGGHGGGNPQLAAGERLVALVDVGDNTTNEAIKSRAASAAHTPSCSTTNAFARINDGGERGVRQLRERERDDEREQARGGALDGGGGRRTRARVESERPAARAAGRHDLPNPTPLTVGRRGPWPSRSRRRR